MTVAAVSVMAAAGDTAATGDRPTTPAASARTSGWRLPLKARHALLTAHIATSVGLLGDSAGFLAVAIRAARTDDPDVATNAVQILEIFSLIFGIPLSFAALITGVALGVGTRWGVFRYPWVTTKLVLVISVMLVGGFVISPAQTEMLDGRGIGSGGAEARLIAAACYDIVALAVATGLGVFKPGRPFRRTNRRLT